MYHTLKTLYQWVSKHDQELVSRFTDLAEYCHDADEYQHTCTLNRGYKSLKWFIYTLRTKLTQDELQQAFHYCLIEAAVRGEENLYDNILSLTVAKSYREFLDKPKIDLSQYPIQQINQWRILINESNKNITNLVFKAQVADIIIFRDPVNQWAGLIFNSKDTTVMDDFDIAHIHNTLEQRREPWILLNNLILCGGPKAPEKKTTITINELCQILSNNYLREKQDEKKEANRV